MSLIDLPIAVETPQNRIIGLKQLHGLPDWRLLFLVSIVSSRLICGLSAKKTLSILYQANQSLFVIALNFLPSGKRQTLVEHPPIPTQRVVFISQGNPLVFAHLLDFPFRISSVCLSSRKIIVNHSKQPRINELISHFPHFPYS